MIFLIGKSGAGKTTLQRELERRGWKAVVSYTTRPKRYEGEDNHIFISRAEFEKLNMMAKVEFNGELYGATEEQICESDIYVIDPEGLKQVKGLGVSIYIKVDDNELIRRMRQRGDSEEMIRKRVENDKEKFKDAEELCDIIFEGMTLEDMADICSDALASARVTKFPERRQL